MAYQLTLEDLPAYSWPGHELTGTLVLATDQPLRASDLTLALHGREVTAMIVSAGKSSEKIVDTYPFLELLSSFHDGLQFVDPEHVAPGTYRLPFRFEIPASAEPSISTAPRPAVRGRLDSPPPGCFVEYELEARVAVPWWLSPIDRVVVPVFSARRVLGTIPPVDSPPSPDHPSFQVRFDPPMILPGQTVTGSYAISNPRGKELPQLTLRLTRHVEYSVKGRGAAFDGPTLALELPLGGRAPSYAGRFELPIPNEADVTGPFHGALYRTWWVAHLDLGVSLGFDVKVEAAFTPA